MRSFGSNRMYNAFTLIELMVILVIVIVSASIMMGAISLAYHMSLGIKCASNLRQLGLAAQMYWNDYGGTLWRYYRGLTNGGRLYWFGWIADGPEGKRLYDVTSSVLYPYLDNKGIELCPAFKYYIRYFKLKATGASYGYGYNIVLSAPSGQPQRRLSQLRDPSHTVLFADAAQVNTFQPPASITNPMLEEFYYISPKEPTTHFRHKGKAQLVCCDGHIENSLPKINSIDIRLDSERVGILPDKYFPF